MAGVDTKDVVTFGTDSAEALRRREAFARQMREDFALWDSSRFEPTRRLAIARAGKLATAYFEVRWIAYRGGKGSRYLLRMATTWKLDAARSWRLVQVLNAVATVGQSAAALAPRQGDR